MKLFVSLVTLLVTASLSMADQAKLTVPIRVALGSPTLSDLAPYVADNTVVLLSESGVDGVWRDASDTNIDVSKVQNPAPKSVYLTEAWGRNMVFCFSGLNPKQPCLVRLHFAETNRSAVGERVFDILINQAPVLTHFDIIKEAGGKFTAYIKELTCMADPAGKIDINLTSANAGDIENAEVRGIEILPSPKATK